MATTRRLPPPKLPKSSVKNTPTPTIGHPSPSWERLSPSDSPRPTLVQTNPCDINGINAASPLYFLSEPVLLLPVPRVRVESSEISPQSLGAHLPGPPSGTSRPRSKISFL